MSNKEEVPPAVLKHIADTKRWVTDVEAAFATWQVGGPGRDGGKGCGPRCEGCLISLIAEAQKKLP